MNLRILTITGTSIALAAAVLLLQGPALAYESPVHTFSIQDVMGGFDGSTYGTGGAQQNTAIICGIPGGPTACPPNAQQPVPDKDGTLLYPVDSQFGYHPVDFLGAVGKGYDFDYMEGFVADLYEGAEQIGIKISNAETDTYKVKAPMGTWCRGLGGNSVKCETEHYTVMEHILSCHEVIPYFYADQDSGEQAVLTVPGTDLEFDCDNAGLDDLALIMIDGKPGGETGDVRLVTSTPCESGTPGVDEDPPGCQIFPNDKTSTQNDVALTTDYSVQLKDDGKALYGWGTIHKRPNDIRMYVKLPLPEEWKGEGAPDVPVTSAKLVITHKITNNPNDQIRPEDLENEAATGRKPSYSIEENGQWKSLVPCYEGDGDIIDTEDGLIDPTFIGKGTVLKNPGFPLGGFPVLVEGEDGYNAANDLYAFSADLSEGLTNAWYTTLNRDPFEWSYDRDLDPNVQDLVGSPVPNDDLGELVSGPRWRLKPNKFGQDLPGLEIPLKECSPPPFQHDNIKYVVGEPTTTVINLLDWADENSPLKSSKGWVDVAANEFVTVAGEVNGIPVTTNGLPMTEDFDLAVYVKGDRKPTAVYTVQLFINEDEEPPIGESDVTIDRLKVPTKANTGSTKRVSVAIVNDVNALDSAEGQVVVSASGVVVFSSDYTALGAGDRQKFNFDWIAPLEPAAVIWEAKVFVSGTQVDLATGATQVR